MPFYEFKCSICGLVEAIKRSVSNRNDSATCVCSGSMDRVYGFAEPTVYESESFYHGWKTKKGMAEEIKKRHRDHLKENLPSMINKHGYNTIKKTSLINEKGKKSTKLGEI